MSDPLGVDSTPPRLSWQLRGDGTRGQRQTARQILVASTRENLDADRGDAWDSGKVATGEQLHVPYGGRALGSNEAAYWKVRVWDEHDRPSPWSATATWTMGLLDPGDWEAGWISDPGLVRWYRSKLGYRSHSATSTDTRKWVEVDLGSVVAIDTIRFLALRYTVGERLGFPPRFVVEVASRADRSDAEAVMDQTAEDYNQWVNHIEVSPPDVRGRYVRLTATKLRDFEGEICLALSQIVVLSGGTNVAAGKPVRASDSLEEGRFSAAAATDGIGVPGTNPRANDTLLLRRGFTVKPGLRRALVHVSGLGQYVMSLDGFRVGKGLLTPGWTDYEKAALYDTYDVTRALRPGDHAVGLLLGGGFYNVQAGRYIKLVTPFRPLMARLQLRLEYDDGTAERVVTDESWRVHPGPITFSNEYGGEDYDSRLEPAGWDAAGFDEHDWTAAVVRGDVSLQMRGASHSSPPFATFETFEPASVRTLSPGVEVYDFGQNASMMPRLRVRGPAGSRVTMIPAELLKPDGSVDRHSVGGGDAWWRYTLSGKEGGEGYFPRFFYQGARYLQVVREAGEGDALPEIQDLTSVVVHSDSKPASEFETSSDLFNRIRTLVHWAQRSNLAHVITDCPHREKLGWLEQYHLNGPSLRFETDLLRLFSKGFGDMADAQLEKGLVPDIAPEYVAFTGGFRDSPEWGSAVILAAWQHMVFTGDDTPLVRNYDVMARYVAYLASRSSGDIVSHGLGDWYDIGPGPPGYAQLTPIPFTATAIYYEDVVTLARIAARLGRDDDARRYTADAARIKDAFNARFFHADTGSYATGSQTAQAMPLVLDLVPGGQRDRVQGALVRDIRAHGNGTTAGDVGYRYVLRALADGGRSDVVFDMNHQSDRPGYGYQLAHGATSLTEAWDANPRSSQNHFMLGQIVEWFYGDLVGLAPDPEHPGFARVRVRPRPVSGITWARAAHASPRGRVAVGWRVDGGTFSLDVEVPPNATAEVWVPAETALAVRESGRPLDAADGVRVLRQEGDRVVVEVGAGRYAFSAESPVAAADGRAARGPSM